MRCLVLRIDHGPLMSPVDPLSLSNEDGTEEGPVTVCIARQVRPGKEAAYEDWVHRISETAHTFPGHLGINVLRPPGQKQGQGGEYVLLVQFASLEAQKRWAESSERAAFIEELNDYVEGDARTKTVSGLEFWFDLPEVPASAVPNQHKMALILSVVVFTLVLAVNLLLGPWLREMPLVLRVAVVVVCQVLLMTYLIMPQVTRLLKHWLYRT